MSKGNTWFKIKRDKLRAWDRRMACGGYKPGSDNPTLNGAVVPHGKDRRDGGQYNRSGGFVMPHSTLREPRKMEFVNGNVAKLIDRQRAKPARPTPAQEAQRFEYELIKG